VAGRHAAARGAEHNGAEQNWAGDANMTSMARTPFPSSTTTSYRTCPLCEATCGLEVTVSGRDVVRIRGDQEDVFSRGFICPKGSTLKQLHEDPDRLRAPLVKRDGQWAEVSWDDAFAEVERRLLPVIKAHGRDAVAIYLGNPTAHNIEANIYVAQLIGALGTGHRYSASTVDQMPKHVSAGLMFGHPISIPIPDVDRTDYLLMLGANPFASNGSLFTAPDLPGRLRALRRRGGKLVVVDPRRTKTAEEADEHLAIRPGTDALFLLGMAHVVDTDGLVDPGLAGPWLDGLDTVLDVARRFPPERVAATCGIDATTIRRLAHELAGAPSAAVYGRIGTCTQEFGSLASWLVDVLNVLTGNLDRPGGAMFPRPVAGSPNTEGPSGIGRGFRAAGSRRTRVRGLPSVLGEFPVATLAEEIDTPGEGRIRALLTVAGNPVLSTQNGARLDAALDQLDCMVSVDIYLNETTRHADVILPPPSPLARGHYDLLLYRLAVRHVANWSPPAFEPADGEMAEWRILLRLAAIAAGDTTADDDAGNAARDGDGDAVIDALDDQLLSAAVHRAVSAPGSRIAGRDPDAIIGELSGPGRRGPARQLDLLLRAGPYGDRFGDEPGGVSLAMLEANPHGIDLGPMEPRLPEVLRTRSGRIELAPEPLLADLERLETWLDGDTARRADGRMLLVGRRDLRSNNSWMHNVDVLVKGKERCTLHLHPADAQRLHLVDGKPARVTSRVGSVTIPVEVTDAIMPGVVSIPHGWGHAVDGIRLDVAGRRPGVNSNLLADESVLDVPSGNGVFSGIPVMVEAV
jgi:anaerobic selenocysteine-containing dehydrogenase